MACECGSTKHEVTTGGCPRRCHPMGFDEKHGAANLGWICPACGKGNAPHASKCGHCAVATTGKVIPHPDHWKPDLEKAITRGN